MTKLMVALRDFMNMPNNRKLLTTLQPTKYSDVKESYPQVSLDCMVLTNNWITDKNSVYVTDKIHEADPLLWKANRHQLTKKFRTIYENKNLFHCSQPPAIVSQVNPIFIFKPNVF